MTRRLLLAFGFLAAALAGPVLAVQPDEMLSDPKLETRARAISQELRCLVCQNQSIDDSNADLAHDLRVLVRARLETGDDDEEVLRYVVNRYGAFVLLKPPVEPATYLLWFGPALLLAVGALGALLHLRRRRRALPEALPLSGDEGARLKRLLEEREL